MTLENLLLSSAQAVLKNGVISGSGFMNSGNVRCGNSVCRPISGVFAKNPLQNGYVHVTTLPAGASNITVTELRNSINFLGESRITSSSPRANKRISVKLNYFIRAHKPSTRNPISRERKVNNLMK